MNVGSSFPCRYWAAASINPPGFPKAGDRGWWPGQSWSRAVTCSCRGELAHPFPAHPAPGRDKDRNCIKPGHELPSAEPLALHHSFFLSKEPTCQSSALKLRGCVPVLQWGTDVRPQVFTCGCSKSWGCRSCVLAWQAQKIPQLPNPSQDLLMFLLLHWRTVRCFALSSQTAAPQRI